MIKTFIDDISNTFNTESNKKLIVSDNLTLDGQYIPIEYGARVVQTSPSNELGKQLLKAAGEGDVKETKSLLTRGALFTADWLGTSPLHLAAQNNHLEVCELLLRAGISKDARTKVDRSPLHVAACEGHIAVVEALLEYGAFIECTDMLGMTPLHWAVQNGYYFVVEKLLEYRANVNAVNKFKLTPKDIAVQINRKDILDLLSASENEENQNVQTPLQLGVKNGTGSTPGNIINSIPLETVLMEDDTEESPEPARLYSNQSNQNKKIEMSPTNNFDESIRILQEHGITMLPNDDHGSILTTVMESGHSVVLTDVGKEMLKFVKDSEDPVIKPTVTNNSSEKKIITITPETLFTLTNNETNLNRNTLKQNITKVNPKTIRRVVMKKNKLIPVTNITNINKPKPTTNNDMETVMKQLIEARKTIEEYKRKLHMKEQEAEKYKEQLKQLMEKI